MTRAVLSSPEDHYGSFKCPYQPPDSSLARSNQIWEGITVHCPVAPATYRLAPNYSALPFFPATYRLYVVNSMERTVVAVTSAPKPVYVKHG